MVLGDREPLIVVATLLPAGAAVFLAMLWLLDRDLIRDILKIAGQANPLARRRVEQVR